MRFLECGGTKSLAGANRPLLRWVAFCAGLACFILAAPWSQAENLSPRESAKAQFQSAEALRAAAESKPEIARSLKDYTSLVDAYRKVYLTTPLAVEDPAAINEVGSLYRKMGDLFDEKYYRSAVDAYQFLLKEYPDSRYREDALLAVAHIEQDNLHDSDAAKSSYEEFLALHPHSPHTAEVRALIAGLNEAPKQPAAAASVAAAAATSQPVKTASAGPAALPAPSENVTQFPDDKSLASTGTSANGRAQLSSIRTWNADSYTRVVIDLGAQVKYQASRIPNPDRIFFDIEKAGIASAGLRNKTVEVPDGRFVKDIRIAQNQPDMIRVVLDVNHASDYSVFFLPDPYRLVVDVYGNLGDAPTSPALDAAGKKTNHDSVQVAANVPSSGPPAAAQPLASVGKKDNSADPPVAANVSSTPALKADTGSKPVVDVARIKLTAANAPANTGSAPTAATKKQNPPSGVQEAPVKNQPLTAKATVPATFDGSVTEALKPETAGKKNAADKALVADVASAVAATKNTKTPHATSESAHDQAAALQPPSIPEPTHNGQESLSRALGLKIGRIVIDPGHGGHDTGTIGPTGLMEKDLCLNVALRVGKLIAERLPGAEVVYTRDDDTFIPLEQRTEIANDARADLFLSIHANSSPSRSARGIETYYLNMNGSSSAMAVAARENSLSENGVHDLQDLVKKIARTEKIAESKDFASDIQDSLFKRMDNTRGQPNRGVRKAPFVVLIGADMPSVLAEISFLSNPADEQWLKKPDNRQRIAEGLYQGIESYLHSTNSLSVDKNPTAAHSPAGNPSAANSSSLIRPGIVARAGNPQ